MAHPGPAGSTPVLNDFNDSLTAVGYSHLAYDINGSGPTWPWLYDPITNPSAAVDLNALNITGLDAGWVIRSAVGVNNNGLVVGYITPLNDYHRP